MNPVVLGIDIASYQRDIDWARARAAGVRFAFIKATEGTDYVNPLFVEQRQGAHDHGIWVSPYHFARQGAGGPQVDHFLSVTGEPRHDELPHMVDAESHPDGSVPDSGVIVDMGLALAAALNRNPILYTTTYFHRTTLGNDPRIVKLYDLFVASWNVSSPSANPWSRWTFWQFGGGQLDGIAGDVDCDYFAGTDAELELYASGGTEPPEDPMGMIVVPKWATIVGGATPHYRLMRSPYGMLLQGVNAPLPSGTAADDGSGLTTVALGPDNTDLVGVDMSPDGTHVVVARTDGHTLEFETGQANPEPVVTASTGPMGPAGPAGPPGPAGAAPDPATVLRTLGQVLLTAKGA